MPQSPGNDAAASRIKVRIQVRTGVKCQIVEDDKINVLCQAKILISLDIDKG